MRAALISVLALCACAPTSSSPTAVERRRELLVETRVQAVAPMTTARKLAGAALLNDGRVIVVGGTDGAGELASTEVYDPRTNRWRAGPSLELARARFVLRNDTELDLTVIGGEAAGSPRSSVEVLRNFGSRFIDGGTLLTPRAGFTASEVLPDVLLLAGGGLSGCEVLDLQSAQSFACTSVVTAVSQSAEAMLPCGDVFMATQGSWLRLPADAGVAEVLGAAPLSSGFTTTLLPDDQVVTVAGANAWVFSSDDGGVFSLPDLSEARTEHRASVLPNDELLVFGGWSVAGARASGELWNGTAWSSFTRRTARANHVQLVLPEGAVLVAGGEFDAGVLASAELLERIDPTLTPIPSTPARAGSSPSASGALRRLAGRSRRSPSRWRAGVVDPLARPSATPLDARERQGGTDCLVSAS